MNDRRAAERHVSRRGAARRTAIAMRRRLGSYVLSWPLSAFLGGCDAQTERGEGPPEIRIQEDHVCVTCTVKLSAIARIGSPQDSLYYFVDNTSLAVNSDGHIFIGPRTPRGDMAIDVYNTSGTYLASLGPSGSGPDEFPYAYRFTLGAADSIVVFDQSRIGVVAPDLRIARLLTPPGSMIREAIHLPDGGMIVASESYSLGAAGMPLQRLGPSGRVVRSFGSLSPEVRPDRPYENRRAIAPAEDGGVWSVAPNAYVIQLWDSAGGLQKVVRRDVDWFPPWQVYPDYLQHRPPPRIMGLHREGDILWVLIAVHAKGWQPLTIGSGEPRDLATALDRQFDSRIEALDIDTGRLIAAIDHPRLLYGFVSSNVVFASESDSAGTPYVNIWTVILETHNP